MFLHQYFVIHYLSIQSIEAKRESSLVSKGERKRRGEIVQDMYVYPWSFFLATFQYILQIYNNYNYVPEVGHLTTSRYEITNT